MFDGSIERYLNLLIQGPIADQHSRCWQQEDGVPICNGDAVYQHPWLTTPTLLMVRVDEPNELEEIDQAWKIPALLTVEAQGIEFSYNLKSVLLGSNASEHFMAVYKTDDGVYAYDGQLDDGAAWQSPLYDITEVISQLGRDWRPETYVYLLQEGPKSQVAFNEIIYKRVEKDFNVEVGDLGWGITCYFRDPLFVADRELDERYKPDKREKASEYLKRPSPLPWPTQHDLSTIHSHKAVTRFDISTQGIQRSVNCRCGTFSDMIVDTMMTYVVCSLCKRLSHLSCIHGGAAMLLEDPNPYFTCSSCAIPTFRQKSTLRKPNISDVPQLQYVLFSV